MREPLVKKTRDLVPGVKAGMTMRKIGVVGLIQREPSGACVLL
jgi:hypothetical protein